MSAAVFNRIAEGLREILGIVRGELPCPICHGSRRVCENCRDKSWPDECHCGAGMNCPLCANEERK